MNRTSAVTACAAITLLAIACHRPACAYTGDDPVLSTGIASCIYTDVQAHIGPSGAVNYKVYGNCSGAVVSGQMAFGNGRFQESFIISNQAKISTLGYCDTDPWATAVNCHDQKVQSSGVTLDPALLSSAPLSLFNGYSAQKFHEAFQHASRPNPPGIPVNLASTYALGRVSAKWLAPDATGDRPFLGFLMQARPQDAEGAAWTDIGTIAWHPALDYRLTGKVPASPANAAWVVRVCSTTTLAASCSPAQVPGGAELATKVESDGATRAALLAAQPAPGLALGRIRTTGALPPICDAAQSARARNSPAAPGLERQCAAQKAIVAATLSPATETASDRSAEAALLRSDAPKALGRVRLPAAGAAPVPADAPAPPVRAPHDLLIGRIRYMQDDQQVAQPVVGKPVTITCNYFVNEASSPFNFTIQPWQGLIQVGGQVPQSLAFQGERRAGQHETRQQWTPSVAGVTPISCLLNPGFEEAEASSGNNRWNETVTVVEAADMPAPVADAAPAPEDDAAPLPGDEAPPPPGEDAAQPGP